VIRRVFFPDDEDQLLLQVIGGTWVVGVCGIMPWERKGEGAKRLEMSIFVSALLLLAVDNRRSITDHRPTKQHPTNKRTIIALSEDGPSSLPKWQ
jgi:hypothetical protein